MGDYFIATKDGKVLAPELYSWDESAKIFETDEDDVIVDCYMMGATIYVGNNSVVCACSNSFIYCGHECFVVCEDGCEIYAEDDCTFEVLKTAALKFGKGCVVVKRDELEVIVLEEENNHIRLLEGGGWENIEELHFIIIDELKYSLNSNEYEKILDLLNELGPCEVD